MNSLDQFLALLRWKRMILLNTLVVAALSVVIALLLPKWYESTASVFPPEEEGLSASGLSGLISAARLSSGKSALPMLASPSDLLAAVAGSRTVREEMIRRFDLIRVYKAKNIDEALLTFRDRCKVKVGDEGVLKVRILDRDPQRAADIANALIEALDRVNREKRHVSARQARVFIAARLEQSRADLAAAEDTLRRLQERTGALLPEEQFKAMVAAASEVQVQLLLREVDLAVLRAQVGADHPDLRALNREVAALRARLREVEQSPDPEEGGRPAGALELPLGRYPEVTVAYLRALREVKVQEAVYEFLIEQFEQYRIQESRDTPMVQVLDRAVPAERKSKPIRWLICVCATAGAFALSLLLAALFEAGARLQREDPARHARLRQALSELGLGRRAGRG